MNLTGIISISGKPGLFRVVAQGKNNIIVESLEDKKRFPAYASDRISALEDISIYTFSEDKPLKEIYAVLFEAENGGESISHKEDAKKLAAKLATILPDYDTERVYPSDIKKLFQWYNLLVKTGSLVAEEQEEKEEKETPDEEKKTKTSAAKTKKTDTEKPAEKKPAAKKAAPAKKTADKPVSKSTPKAATAKKAAAPKAGGTSRGK